VSEAQDAMSIALLGGGGHASDVLNVLERLGLRSAVFGYFDDAQDLERMRVWGVPRKGSLRGHRIEQTHFVLGVGLPLQRMSILDRLEVGESSALTLVDPDATLGHGCETNAGSLILAGARLSPLVSLGAFVYLSQNCSIGHDAQLDEHVCVMPGAIVSGDCAIHRGVTIGTGSVILPGIAIGEGAFVGAGAVVTRDVEPGQTVVGSPAKPLGS
jgi:sugar O-acyltransferase (sialic acid O-acetyltransferase NeuD family)